MIRPGVQVARPGIPGRGQVIRVDGAWVEVLWRRGGKRERAPQVELAWVGLQVHTRDGRAGRVIELGKIGNVRVRLSGGGCYWMGADELAPHERAEQSELVETCGCVVALDDPRKSIQ